MSSSILRPATGRAELLNWINTLCVANYSTVTHLSDAVLYCTVVELLSSQKSTSSSSSSPFTSILEKLPSLDCNADDYGDDLVDHGRSGAGRPVPNARQLAERRFNNCKYLEQLLRSVAPTKWSLQLDPERLASGKLQDHMVVLAHLNKWFCSHVNAGHKLRFVGSVDPATRRMQLASSSSSSSSSISPSLMVPRSAPIRDAHARFLDSLGLFSSAHNDDDDDDNYDHSTATNKNSCSVLEKAKATTAMAPASTTGRLLPTLTEENILFREIHINLDDAAVQLDARREQLERDAVSLKRLVDERDRMKLKLRKAYENLMLTNVNNNNKQEYDASAGFKMDIEKLFQDASNGKGTCSAASILFKAMQKV